MGVTHRLPDDEKLLAAIGVIALRHGQLDNQLRMTIGDLTSVTKEQALDATARAGSSELRERIRKFARQRLGDGHAFVLICALLQRARRATDTRNELLHSVWGTEQDDDGPMMRQDDHTFKPVPTVEELKDLEDEMIAILDELVAARFRGFLWDALQKPSK